MDDKLGILSAIFGYAAFREGQEELIEAILSGRDALGVMPTGAGKSICYQIPALLFDGITLVISPLISLMKDQVSALVQAGVRAAYINSSLTPGQQQAALRNARAGMYKIIYVAPERLLVPDFFDFAQNANISFVSIDEAHCVSQWGQDFRPSYLGIPEFIGRLPNRPVLGAFTATATARVREDIVRLLGLANPLDLITGFDRPNLYFEVQTPKNRFAALDAFLSERESLSGIVYCLTRKITDELYSRLRATGRSVTRYHAGLPAEERRMNQELFQTDETRVMIATNAFGMGIDKSNIAYVLHYNMPMNMESYYQEAGRAGRDGSPAECILYYGAQDIVINRMLIDRSEERENQDEEAVRELRRLEHLRLGQMADYCFTDECLRGYILRYFGEDAHNNCGNCGSCAHAHEMADITREAIQILSCVKDMKERFGKWLIIDTLRGKKNEKVTQFRMDTLPAFGSMKDTGAQELRAMIDHLAANGYLAVSKGEYPTLSLAAKAAALMEGEGTVSIRQDRIAKKEQAAKTEKAKAPAKPKAAAPEPVRPALFKQLQEVRLRLAREQKMPAYIIFHDSALRELCAHMPRNAQEFQKVPGVGERRAEKYGEAFLEVILAYSDD